jgi:predicted Zn finger-like uncharacterized protein
MIIQCPHCQSRFKLATEKIKPGGTKVRCTRCKSIFIVTPPEKGQKAHSDPSEKFDSQDEWAEFCGTGDDSAKDTAFDQEESPAWGEKTDFLGGNFDPAEFFNAGDEDTEFFLNGEPAEISQEPAGQTPVEGDAPATGFSEEPLHDWTEEESPVSAAPVPEASPDGQKPPLVLAEEVPPPAEFAGHSGMEGGAGELLQVELDMVPPPPTVPSRRSAKGPVLLLVLLVAALGTFGYHQYSQNKLPWLSAYLKRLQGVPEVPSIAGKLVPVEISGYYVENNHEGRMFVVHGKVVNEFIEARASISVAGLVYDRQGKVIARQTAFCGNSMSKSQLRSQPFARMEERMNNEFGEFLTNINVEPKKAVPFTIVFRDLTEEVAEFGVEVVDSKPVAK